jgi:hypothetical protein
MTARFVRCARLAFPEVQQEGERRHREQASVEQLAAVGDLGLLAELLPPKLDQALQMHPALHELIQERAHLLTRLHERRVRRSRPPWVHAGTEHGLVPSTTISRRCPTRATRRACLMRRDS